MDSREQRVRARIAELHSDIASLKAQLDTKAADLQRYEDALRIWLSVDVDDVEQHVTPPPGAPPTANQRALSPVAPAPLVVAPVVDASQPYAGRRLIDCVRDILAHRGPQTSGALYDALLAGGFKSDSLNFRGVVTNMLNEATKDGRLVKDGKRANAVFRLPEQQSPLLDVLQDEEAVG